MKNKINLFNYKAYIDNNTDNKSNYVISLNRNYHDTGYMK